MNGNDSEMSHRVLIPIPTMLQARTTEAHSTVCLCLLHTSLSFADEGDMLSTQFFPQSLHDTRTQRVQFSRRTMTFFLVGCTDSDQQREDLVGPVNLWPNSAAVE